MAPSSCSPDTTHEPVLTTDQQRACERLCALARVRSTTTEAELPIGVLNRWSVPLLLGPAASGKAFVCEEVARRWGRKPCRRWEVGSWITNTNRSRDTTPEQIQAFIEANPAGCVVYLAGMDALAVKADHNASYSVAIAAQITQLLDRASTRPVHFPGREGKAIPANVLVVVGGCFAALWGDAAIDGPSGREAWRLADRDGLAGADAVAKWLLEHSRLPADILRRLAPDPLILHRIEREQADQLALRLRDGLPPSLDGLGADEFSAALQSPHGWRAVAALVERAWVEGHEHLLPPPTNAAIMARLVPPTEPPVAKPVAALLPTRLGERLGIPSTRSRLVARARRLGLRTAWDMEKLAIARGYCLPGEDVAGTTITESVERIIFTDTELTAVLLSPCLEMNARVICRGAWMLAAQLAHVGSIAIADEARRARGETVVRHMAWLGSEIYPQHRRWRDLLLMLPSVRVRPAFAPGIMPDEAIRRVLSASRH